MASKTPKPFLKPSSWSFWYVGSSILATSAIVLWVLAILVGIGFAIARKGQIAAGIFSGVGIGIVGVGLSCFAIITQI